MTCIEAHETLLAEADLVIGTLRGAGGRGVGDYTSLNRPY